MPLGTGTGSGSGSARQNSRELEESKDSMTCAICVDLYTDARVLSCSHTFCKGCLISYQAEGFMTKECPKCRKLTVPRIDMIEQLPVNVFANKATDLIRQHIEGIDAEPEGNQTDDPQSDFYVGDLLPPDDGVIATTGGPKRSVIGASVVAGAAFAMLTGGVGGVLAGIAIAGIGTASSSEFDRAYKAKMKQKFICSFCNKESFYIRYKCGMCTDYAICCECFNNASNLKVHDPQHIFMKFPRKPLRYLPIEPLLKEQARDLSDSYVFSSTNHVRAYIHTPERLLKVPAIKCRTCGCSPIRGIRYKCGHCNNFDLCSGCEKYSHSLHKNDHVFLVIRYHAEINVISEPLLKAKIY